MPHFVCAKVIKKLGGADWPTLKVEFDQWRTDGQAIFPPGVWEAAEKLHGFQWWSSFGDDFTMLNKVAADVLSKAILASACEFSWSDVGHVITKQTNRLGDEKVEKLTNIRAMHKLEKHHSGKTKGRRTSRLSSQS